MSMPREEFDDSLYESDDDQESESRSRFAAAPVWAISILVHGLVLASLVYMLMPREMDKLDDIISAIPIPFEADQPEDVKVIDVIKSVVEVKVEVSVEVPPIIVEEEEVVDHVETENDALSENAEGLSEAVSDQPLVGSGVMGNMGGGGAFGRPTFQGRKQLVMKNGGSPQTEGAVELGLKWLASHQEIDGHWDSGKYEGAGNPEADSACTAAALLAFLGAGYTDRVGKWRKNVKSAISWLIECQRPNGSFDARNYSNGMCTMAIAEAVGMGAGGSKARKAAELAVDYLIKEQNDSGGFDYTGPSGRNDMSVTGWCVMGLKAAKVSDIRADDIRKVFGQVGVLMNADENAATTGDNSSGSKGLGWYTSGKTSPSHSAVTAIAMLTRQYLGWKQGSPWLAAAAAGQASHLPKDFKTMNVYRVYYAYLTLFQQSGPSWKVWNKPVSNIIVKAQRTDGDFKGSWDNNGKGHMSKGGRVLTTAFLVMSLEVYYRYLSITKG